MKYRIARNVVYPVMTAGILTLSFGLQADTGHTFERLSIALEADPVGVEPGLHLHAPGKLVVQHIGEALVAHRDDMSVAPMLAESFEVSTDGLTYTFHIREQASFHNGEPVTAADVVWAWNNYYLNPETDWHCKTFYDGSGSTIDRTTGGHIKSIDASSDMIVVFTLHESSNLFLARMADVSCAPVIFHRDSMAKDGSWDKLIATGPYRFSHWNPGEDILLTRFDEYVPREEPKDGYSGAKVAFAKEIHLPIIPDRQEAFAQLKAGKIDAVRDVRESERMWLENSPGIRIDTTSTINFWNLLLMSRNPALSDVRMRRAIAHAIDLDYIAAVLTEGRQQANPSVISAASLFHTPVHDQRIQFNPAASKALLQELSYDGSSIEIQTNLDGLPEMYRIGVLVRSMLRAVGINAALNVMPWKEQLDTHYRSAKFQLQAFGQGGRNHPALVYGKFIGPESALSEADGKYQRLQWIDDEAFALVNRAEVATTIAEQISIYEDLHIRMLENIATLPLLNFEHHDAVREGVQGFHTTPFIRTTLWGVWKEGAL